MVVNVFVETALEDKGKHLRLNVHITALQEVVVIVVPLAAIVFTPLITLVVSKIRG